MIRLSRAGWNNVLIFSSLLMIFLFNGMHLKMFANDDQPQKYQSLLPTEQMILTVDFPNLSVERIGRSWRTVPRSNHSIEHIQDTLEQWQQLQGMSIQNFPAGAAQHPDAVISFWFAGHKQAFVLQVYQLTESTIVQTPTGLFQLQTTIDSLIL